MNWLLNIPLSNILLISAVLTGIGVILLISIYVMQRCITKLFNNYTTELNDDKRKRIQIKFTYLKQIHKTFFFITILTFVIALSTVSLYAIYRQKAIRYGAYGDFTTKESILDVHNKIQYGFIDQSNELPDDLSGYIIIFVKYGCPDCANIHDRLLACLEENHVENVLFVSSRSEAGKALIEQYPIDVVPTGIYIRTQPTSITRYTEILYDTTPDEGQTDLFVEENMLRLIEHQRNND